MIRPQTLRQLAAYSISLPAFAGSPKLAKETVYMPSRVAEQTLGTSAKRTEPARESEQPAKRGESERQQRGND